MKTTKTIEILKCDFCDANDNDDDIETCNMCGKDFCIEHGCQYDNNTGYYNEKKEEEYSKIFLCNDCIKKFFQKAKRAGFIKKKDTQEIDGPGTLSLTDALHDKLVKLGGEWLMKNTPVLGNCECSKCSIVTTEIVTFASEIPDVLGFANNNKSVLLEAKISREDFKRDFKKNFRVNPEEGMGEYRLYIAPKGLIKPEELPNKWGLIEVNEKDKCKLVKYAEKQSANKAHEMYVLTSLIKRIGQNPPKGVSIRCYTYETKNNATLMVDKEK